MKADPYNLQRFVDAQDPVIERVLEELAAGRKRTHWMWFVFPQVQGLGFSATAQEFAIKSRAEAAAYAAHPALGPRLTQCTQLAIDAGARHIEDIFGYPDDLKFRSSMTLFMACAPDNVLFAQAIDQYFQGKPDDRTLAILARM